jgi:hypothetical protein
MDNIFFGIKSLVLLVPFALVIALVGLVLMEGLLRAVWYAVREERIEIPAPTQDLVS